LEIVAKIAAHVDAATVVAVRARAFVREIFDNPGLVRETDNAAFFAFCLVHGIVFFFFLSCSL